MPQLSSRGNDARREEEQQFTGGHAGVVPFEQVADDRQAAEDRNLRDVDLRLGNNDAADHDGRAIGNGNLAFRGLRIQRRNALNARNTLIDLGILDQHVHVHGAFRRNLGSDFQLEHGVDVLHGNGVVDGGLNRNLHTLLDRGLFVVLGHDARLGEQLADALGLRCGDKEVHGKVGRPVREPEAAGWHAGAQCGVERDAGGLTVTRRRTAGDSHWGRRKSGSGGYAAASDRWSTAKKRSSAGGASGKSELRTDILRKGTRCRYHPGFDLHLLRFAIELMDQVINCGDDRRNIADDELVRTRVGKNVAASGQKLLQGVLQGVGLGIAEHARHGNHFLRVVFRSPYVASRLRFLLDGVQGRNAQDVAVQLLVEAVVLQDDVERLIPRNLVQNDGESSLYVGVQHDVEAADLVNQAEEIPQVHVLEIYRDGFTTVSGWTRRHRGLRRGLRRGSHGGRSITCLLHGLLRRFLRGDGPYRFIFPAKRCQND